MSKNLVIVESPAKAKTISKYLGDDFVVESSVGHVRDLPSSAKEVPPEYKKEKWSRLGVNVENDFEPIYIINENRKKQIAALKKLMKEADALYLATDEDREGEAIAWHLLQVLKPPKTMDVHRMVFHEITEEAIKEAVESPRDINQDLVNAQEARRILDRLYGYEVSPVLWKKIATKLSAGRVQSVVKKMLVDKEKERMKFITAEFAELTAKFKPAGDTTAFETRLDEIDGKKVAQSSHFDSDGKLNEGGQKIKHLGLAEAKNLSENISSAKVASKTSRPYSRKPSPPLTTSDLQQTAGNRLGMSSAMIMSAAQQLYQQGYITYMRTDANNLAASALETTRQQIKSEFGDEYLSKEVRTYKNKAKNAQEAHEAIRPTGSTFITPEEMSKKVAPGLAQVYAIIYERTVASQMTDAKGTTTTYKIETKSGESNLVFSVSGTVIEHLGFRKATQIKNASKETDKKAKNESEEKENTEQGAKNNNSKKPAQEIELPNMTEGESLDLESAEPTSKETTPPARYSEARLVATLDEIGVGRPSTYASTIKTVLNRGYAFKQGSQIIPTFTAFAVVQLLELHFPDLVDFNYTARLEETLDNISLGKMQTVEWLRDFYKGSGESVGLSEKIEAEMENIDARAVSTVRLGKDENGNDVDVRVGKYGPFVSREEDTASIPPDIPPADMTLERAIEILSIPKEKVVGTDPETGMSIVGLRGRYGQYLRLGTTEELEAADTDLSDAKTAGLFESMSLADLTLEDAKNLLSLPRVVGEQEGEEIIAANGPFGPYLKRGRETRQLKAEEELLTISLEECIKLFSVPKKFQRRGGSTGKEVGTDPMTGETILVKKGRFGTYVTDGNVNASLRDTDDPNEISVERASELLNDRRERLALAGDEPKSGKTTSKKPATRKKPSPKTTRVKAATKNKAKTS